MDQRDKETFLGRVRDLVRFARQREAGIEEAGRLDQEVRDEMAELGLFGMVLPESEGGLGLDLQTGCRAMEWIGTTHPALRVALSGSNGLVGPLLALAPVALDKRGWLRHLADGSWSAALAFSEPDAGSRLEAMGTEAIRDSGAWVLTGDKAPVTEGALADLVVVVAVTDPGAPVRDRFSLFMVRKGEFALAWDETTWASHAHRLAGLEFRELLLHEDRLVGSVGGGLRFLSRALVPARLMLAAAAVGLAWRLVAESALKAGRPWPRRLPSEVAHRPQELYASLADLDSVSGALGQMAADLAASRRLVHQAAGIADRWLAGDRDLGRAARRGAAAAKLAASQTASRIADAALEILGSPSVLEGGLAGVLLREAKLLALAEGSNQLLRRSVAGDILRAARRDLRGRKEAGVEEARGGVQDQSADISAMSHLDSLLESL